MNKCVFQGLPLPGVQERASTRCCYNSQTNMTALRVIYLLRILFCTDREEKNRATKEIVF
eukprot:724106-Amphidinium_carterae.2